MLYLTVQRQSSLNTFTLQTVFLVDLEMTNDQPTGYLLALVALNCSWPSALNHLEGESIKRISQLGTVESHIIIIIFFLYKCFTACSLSARCCTGHWRSLLQNIQIKSFLWLEPTTFFPHKVYKCGVCGFYIIDLLGQLLNIRSNLASLQHNFASLRFWCWTNLCCYNSLKNSEANVDPYQMKGLCLITSLIKIWFAFPLCSVDGEEIGKKR